MNKILLLFCVITIVSPVSYGRDIQSLTPIIQRQSKQIQQLQKKIAELQEELKQIKSRITSPHITDNHISNNQYSDSTSMEGEVTKTNNVDTLDNTEIFPLEEKDIVDLNTNIKQQYEYALATLKDNKLEEAETLFANFIAQYPESNLQSNATFWYAESFYRRGNFHKAAIEYLQSYKKFPSGSKAPDALLKLAYSLASLNKHSDACNILAKLETEFPQKPIHLHKKALEAKDRFNCK
jgi:tol-pal system protein YbgF